MGTKVQCKSSLPGFYPMRELNNDSNSHNWHLFYGERSFTNAQYHKVILPRGSENGYLGDDKDVVKQKMLEHEAIFKNQVFELHRLYRRQRDLMDKIKSTGLSRNRLHVDSLLSSSPLTSQVTSEDALRRNLPCFPMENSSCTRFSISGVEEGHSSLISIKGINSQMPGFFPQQNESTVKDLQVFESRPTKLRKKMLDLQLPADEYIDSEDGEQFHDGNVADTLSDNHITAQKIDLERDAELYDDDSEQTGRVQNARKLGTCFEKNTSCLTDLNEPIQLVETNASTYVDPLSSASFHEETQCSYPSSGPKFGPIILQRKCSLKSDNGSDNMTGNNLNLDKNTSRGRILPHLLESGHSYNSKNLFPHGLQAKVWPVSSQPMEIFLSEIHEAPPYCSTGKGRAEQSREGQVFGFQLTKRSPEIKGEPSCTFVPSHTSTPHPLASDFSKSWSNSNSSGDSASTNFQKLKTAQAQQCMNSVATTDTNFHCTFNGMESSGEMWLLSNDSQLTKGSDSELSYYNRVFLGSSSEYKEEVGHPSSGTYNYQMQGNGNNQAPKDLSPSMSLKLLKDSNLSDMKGLKERNFNMVFSKKSSGQAESVVGEDCKSLPLFRGTASGITEITDSDRFSNAEELIYVRSSINSLPDKNSLSCLARPPIRCETKESRECRVLDVNLPCDPLVSESDNLHSEKPNEAKLSSFGIIDLNLSPSVDEESFRPTPKSTGKMWGEIDLEAPASSEVEDIVPAEKMIVTKQELASKPHCKDINQEDELMKLGAEAMVLISSSICPIYLEDATCSAVEDCAENPLNLLAEMAFLCSDVCESESQAALRAKPSSDEVKSSLKGVDTFESMTLGLVETKAEDYMPRFVVPGHIRMEEKAINLLSRPRRGQGRRGRQRRDFQRDILPGLASLSRQDVTEDLNTFGGLMREMGHEWTSGLAKRNSSRNVASGRGRQRLVTNPSLQLTENLPLLPQPSKTEMRLDKRSLTGWGKTTRRPRRQRVPAGNLAAIALV